MDHEIEKRSVSHWRWRIFPPQRGFTSHGVVVGATFWQYATNALKPDHGMGGALGEKGLLGKPRIAR